MLKHVYKLYAKEGLDALWKWAMEPKTPRGKARRFGVLAEFASRKRANADQHDKEVWADRAKTYRAEQDKYERRAKRRHGKIPPVVDGGWHPDADRDPYPSSGSFTAGHKKVVLHTTEGYSLPSYQGSNPHFTLDPKTGKFWQHVSIAASSSALVNLPGNVETNHAGAIQIEMIGFAAQTPGWTDDMYANVKDLVRWIRKHAGIGTAHPAFSATPHRMGGQEWLDFNGVCGHQHVPENEHWDPGAFKVDKVI